MNVIEHTHLIDIKTVDTPLEFNTRIHSLIVYPWLISLCIAPLLGVWFILPLHISILLILFKLLVSLFNLLLQFIRQLFFIFWAIFILLAFKVYCSNRPHLWCSVSTLMLIESVILLNTSPLLIFVERVRNKLLFPIPLLRQSIKIWQLPPLRLCYCVCYMWTCVYLRFLQPHVLW